SRQLPTLPIFAGQVSVGFLQVCDLPSIRIEQQPLATKSQRNRCQVERVRNRLTQQKIAVSRFAPLDRRRPQNKSFCCSASAPFVVRFWLRAADHIRILTSKSCNDLSLVPHEHHPFHLQVPLVPKLHRPPGFHRTIIPIKIERRS